MAFSSFKAFLDIAQEPEKADAIFVFAGREERKRLGIELFRAELTGYAVAAIFRRSIPSAQATFCRS